ncbi:MAG: phosphoglucomutase/phosphomannomutase family protein [Acidobacteria bacterium]|nr:phosphoglucomutase/phosphomannomutase family protein [Acidobacteriota bacterium]
MSPTQTKAKRRRKAAAPAIHFGTDGWRGIIARDFTRENVTLVARALARYLVEFEDIREGVIVGYDTRFAAGRFARQVAEILTSVGVDVRLASGPTPTPALSHAVRHYGAAAGVMLTASHNPPEWLGIKLKASYGGSASSRAVSEVERMLGDRSLLPRVLPQPRRIEIVDLKPAYLARLAELVELQRIADAGLRLAVDPMHGAGAGCLRGLFAARGITCHEVRGTPDPLFGGAQPEPIEASLAPLRQAVLEGDCDAGLATDGDADRVAALDAAGRFVDPHKIFALLLRHLVERKNLRGGVARTVSVSKMIDKMAEHYGLEFHETPIGFKHIAELMLEQNLLIGGEESGGIGIRPHLPERDGLLVSLLLAEIIATEGKPLAECVADLQRQFGPLHYRRVDLHLDPAQKQRALERLADDKLRKLADRVVIGRETTDGIKFYLFNAGWVMARASGTEPVLRIYAEAPEPALLDRVVAAVEGLVRTA